MRPHGVLFFLFLLLGSPLLAQEVSYLPQVGDGSIEVIDLGLQTEFIFVNSGGPTEVEIAFFSAGANGGPMTLDLEGIGAVSKHDFALGSGDSTSFSTTGAGNPVDGSPQVGYAVVTVGGQQAGTSGSGVGGTAVFIQTELSTGRIINEAGVPSGQRTLRVQSVCRHDGYARHGSGDCQHPGVRPSRGLYYTDAALEPLRHHGRRGRHCDFC